jgi:4-hydroxy-2-oxoheptanedioate aldolase
MNSPRVLNQMSPSRVLEKLRGGQVASCVKINLSDARVAEIAARAGFDAVWLDMEHVPNSLQAIEHSVRAIRRWGCDPLVRVKRGSYSDLVHPLEMDAAGIMVPHVMSLTDAKDIVRQTRFHPIGRRPLDGGNADGGYTQVPLETYLRQSNEQRFVIVQIEDPEPLADLDAIAALPGIDMIFFGPGDFSQGIGAPGVWDHPELVRARQAVARAARTHHKFAGTVGSSANLQSLIDEGYQFISVGADVVGLSQYFSTIMQSFHPHLAPTTQSLYGGINPAKESPSL